VTELVICRGMQASGKTTWARAWVAEDTANRARVNKDEMRRQMHDGVYLGHDTEQKVNIARDSMIDALLSRGVSVVSDDTNLSQSVARGIARIGRKQGATVVVQDFTHVSLDECVRRDANRDHSLGEKVLLSTYDRYLNGKKLPLPEPVDSDQTPSSEHTPYIPNLDLPGCWIVDIDGTLAIRGERSPFDWDRVQEDILNVPVWVATKGIASQGIAIAILSGRDSVCRNLTIGWLKHYHVPCDVLYMREEGDSRKDAIVKRELLDEVAKDYRVIGVLDDRDQVVEMWREVGLPCFQVAPGAF
jgi:predicted kinase